MRAINMLICVDYLGEKILIEFVFVLFRTKRTDTKK